MPTKEERLVFITGACGGIGRSIAELFAVDHVLVLCDLEKESLLALSKTLTDQGARVCDVMAGDINNTGFVEEIGKTLKQHTPLKAFVHTAATSTAFADWQQILDTTSSQLRTRSTPWNRLN